MRKILSAALAITLFSGSLSGLNYVRAEKTDIPDLEENQAYALLTKEPNLTNFSAVKPGEDENEIKTASRDGVDYWYVDISNGDKSYQINFDLDDKYAYAVSDGSEFEIEVEYYNDAQGYLQLVYDSADKEEKYNDFIVTDGSKTWSKQTFVLEDAYFANRLGGKYDFQLTAKVPATVDYPTSPASVCVKSVKVTRTAAKYPIIHKGWTDETGNAFEWFKDEKILKNEFKNTLDKEINAQVTYRAVDSDGVERWNKSESVKLAPGEVKQTEVNVDIDYCQLYTLYVDIEDADSGISEHLKRYEFAIIKTDPDGIQNKKHYFNTHTHRQGDRLEESFEMLKKSNTYGIRWQLGWYECEPAEGTYMMPEQKQTDLELMAKYGIHGMWLLYACPSFHTGGWSWIPRSESALNAFEKYLRWKIKYLKENSNGMIDRFEFWNEPNIRLFNGGGGVATSIDVEVSPEEYVPAAQVAYKVTKEIFPEMEFGVLSICDVTSANSYAWLTRSMDAGLGDYCDAITLHPYGVADDVGMAKTVRQYKSYVDEKYNKDVKVWNTEVGYSTVDSHVQTEERHKDYNLRAFLYYLGENVGDAFVTYNMERGGDVPIARENFFGTLTPAYDNCVDRHGNAFIPRKTFVGITAMNYLTALAECDKKGNYSDDGNTFIYKLKSEKFNSDILTLWCNKGTEEKSLNLGAKQIDYYDEFGNKKTLYSDDGIYTFHITESPFYLIGNFNKFTESDVKKFSVADSEISAAKGDMAVFGINVSDELSDCDLEFEIPVGSTLCEEPVIKNGKATVKLELGDSVTEDFFLRMNLTRGGKIMATADIDITLKSVKATAVMNASLKNMTDMNKWNGKATITNSSERDVLTGKLIFKGPELFADMKPIDIGRIPRGKTSEVWFSFPDITQKGIYSMNYEIQLDSGEVYENTDRIDFAVSKYRAGDIKIDGTLSPGEWDDGSWMYAEGINNISFIMDKSRYGGNEDCSGRATTAWDEENFYFAAEITDDVHFNNVDHSVSYQCDDIQFAIYHDVNAYLAAGNGGTKFNEFGIALNEEGPGLYKWVTQTDDTKVGYVTGEGVECAVVRGNGVTYYEAKLPWKVILGYDFTPEAGGYIGFSYLINDNDGDGRAWGVCYAGGIMNGKNSALFSKLQFVKPE